MTTPSMMRDCCVGHHVRFGLSAFVGDVSKLFKFVDNTTCVGYVPALIDQLSLEMGFTYEIENVPVADLWWRTFGTPGMLSPAPYSTAVGGTIDAALTTKAAPALSCGPDPRWTCALDFLSPFTQPAGANGMGLLAQMTGPVYIPRIGGLVKRSVKPATMFRFFMPFSGSVWLSIVAALLASALAMYLVDELATRASSSSSASLAAASKPAPRARRDTRAVMAHAADVVYHSIAVALQADEREWPTWPARFVRIALLFCFLVLLSCFVCRLFVLVCCNVHNHNFLH